MDEHFRRALKAVAEDGILRTDINGGYVFAPRKSSLLTRVDIAPSAAGDDPTKKEIEEAGKRAELAMAEAGSAESGAASVSSFATKELLVADSQCNVFR